jgi:hypothetical protein
MKIEDESKSFNIEIDAVANYTFENKETLDI